MPRKVEQREASIEKLLGAALNLFVSQGYRSTTLEQIAATAGLTKGAVYFYFRSKAAVLIELLARVQTYVVDQMIQSVEAAGPSPQEKLVAFLHNQARLGVTRRDEVLLLILMSLEFNDHDDEVMTSIDSIYRRLRKFVERLVRAGQESGDFRGDVPARELAAIIIANHDGTFLEWRRRSAALDGRKLVRALRSVVLYGLVRPREASAARSSTKRRAAASRA